MDKEIQERVLSIARDIIAHQETIRNIAKVYNVSKSTVHKDLSSRLLLIDPQMYEQVKKLMEYNKSMRHIRGGHSTKLKYLMKR
ncbi:MAG TPA: sporulation transcriptional regulator SpoIIID [Haloplasmataceae bacterium]